MIAARSILMYVFAAVIAAVALAQPAQAQLSFSLRTGNDTTKTQSMVYDSNKCNAATPEGPKAMFLGGRVINNGATTRTNVTATLSGLTNGFFLAGGQPATLQLGSIGPGQSAGAFWFIGYGCTNVTSNPTISITSAEGNISTGLTLTGTSTLSANATGFLESTTLGPGAVVGQTIALDVQYSFGGSSVGDEMYLQPTGTQNFNAACFRLVGNEIIQSEITSAPVGTLHRTYFVQTASNKKTTITSRYFFEYQCAGASTTTRPYAMGTSGQALKYTGNYDSAATTFTITFPGATNPFTITKTADKTTAYAGYQSEVVYTVTVTNPSPYTSRISSFTDTLPTGASFVEIMAGSNVTAANSSNVPTAGATGTLTFGGIPDSSYSIGPGGSVKLVYRARMSPLVGTYLNSAKGNFGSASTQVGQHTFTVTEPPPLTVIKSSQAASDPMNGTANPKAIPGARMAYTIQVANPYLYTVTSNTVVITDATPPQLKLYVADLMAGSGPVIFQNSTPSSGLSYSFVSLASQTDDVDFSSNGGTVWTYVPVPDASGADASVTHIRIRPQGAMNPTSSFSMLLSYVIK